MARVNKGSHWICIPNRHKEMAPFFFLCFSQFRVERRSSYPFLTGDTWRFFCDWRLTENETFEPEQVRRGDTIFVEYQLLETFQSMVRAIKHRFILITPNVENYSDGPLPGNHRKLLRGKKIAVWFLQNIDCDPTERLIPIPIGLPNNVWTYGKFQTEARARDILAYVNFNVDTNPKQRKPCLEYFSSMDWAQVAASKTVEDYFDDLSRSLFVVSPPGVGVDCHRTWEALYLGCYPLVLSSTLNPLYEGLPVVIVHSWAEVTEKLLQRKREEFQKVKWDLSKLYMPYWVEKVQRFQEQLRGTSVQKNLCMQRVI